MINKKKKCLEVFLVMVLVITLSLVSASVGISKEYYEGAPLKIGPGETKEAVWGLIIASEETEDKTLEFEMIDGSEIASLLQDSIVVPAGSRDNEIKIRVSIPETVAEGTKYSITVKVKDVSASEGTGMVTMTESQTSSIPVLVEKTEEETPSTLSTTWIIVGIVVILLIIIVVWIMKKNQNSEPVKK